MVHSHNNWLTGWDAAWIIMIIRRVHTVGELIMLYNGFRPAR